MPHIPHNLKNSTLPPDPDVYNLDLPGVGSVLKEFEAKYSSYDVDVLNHGNQHNETNVNTICHTSFLGWLFSEPLSADTTTISGYQVGNKDYKLAINVNSEASTLMWNGKVTSYFKYDADAKTWSMSAKILRTENSRIIIIANRPRCSTCWWQT